MTTRIAIATAAGGIALPGGSRLQNLGQVAGRTAWLITPASITARASSWVPCFRWAWVNEFPRLGRHVAANRSPLGRSISGHADGQAVFNLADRRAFSPLAGRHRWGRLRWVTETPRAGQGYRGTARGTSTGRTPVHCVRSGQIPETLVQAGRAVWPSSSPLIRGFGVRVPGGAPRPDLGNLPCYEVDLRSRLQLGCS